MTRILSVVGARPQFVKLAAISRALPESVSHSVTHTGQHYDPNMSESFFTSLGLDTPAYSLGVGSKPHARQTAEMLQALEGVIKEDKPEIVLLYGDTNSTLAGAIAASKLAVQIAHLEAGLRSFNRSMPEEINRIVSDHISDLCMAPSERAMNQLAVEGLKERSILVGDVMVDVLLDERLSIEKAPPSLPWNPEEGDYAIATFHRQEITSNPQKLASLIETLQQANITVYLPTHPRLARAMREAGIRVHNQRLNLIPPLSYREMVWALMNAKALVTDSGGLQKEAFVLRVPAATVRTETEWPETIELGWNQLIWDDLFELSSFLEEPPIGELGSNPFGSGSAAKAAVDALLALSG